MIAGFLEPDGGDIFFDDARMTEVPPHQRNTAMVFQSYALVSAHDASPKTSPSA